MSVFGFYRCMYKLTCHLGRSAIQGHLSIISFLPESSNLTFAIVGTDYSWDESRVLHFFPSFFVRALFIRWSNQVKKKDTDYFCCSYMHMFTD